VQTAAQLAVAPDTNRCVAASQAILLRVAVRAGEPQIRWTSNFMTHSLYTLLEDLESASIHFALARDRDFTVRVNLTLVGEHVEIDVFDDGHMGLSRFPGRKDVVGDESLVRRIIAENDS
jgi:hypothetical protein